MKVVYHLLFFFFSFLRWSFLSSGLPSSFRPFEGTRTEIDNLTEPRPSPPSVVEPDVRCEPYYDLADTIHLSGALRARSGPIAWTGGLALVIRTCCSDLPARSGTGGYPGWSATSGTWIVRVVLSLISYLQSAVTVDFRF